MGIIYVLLPASVVIALIFVAFYVRAVQRGDFDDLDTPPERMLQDDEDKI